MSEPLLNALRGLRLADPDLGLKPLLAKLREQQPDLGAATREVREALTALKAEESEAAKATPAQPAADEGGVPSNVALSLACIGCYRLPSDTRSRLCRGSSHMEQRSLPSSASSSCW